MINIFANTGAGGIGSRIIRYGDSLHLLDWNKIIGSFLNAENLFLSVPDMANPEKLHIVPLTGSVEAGNEVELVGHQFDANNPSVVTYFTIRYNEEEDLVDIKREVKVSDENAAVVVNGKVYEDFAAAIEDAQDGDVVVMTKDVEMSEPTIVNKKITLDLNGKSLYTSNKLSELLYVTTDVDIYGNGGSVDAYSHIETWDANVDYNMAVRVMEGAKVRLFGGDYKAGYEAVYVYDGVAEIYGGTFFAQPDSSRKNVLFEINCYDANFRNGKADVVIYGGNYYNFDPRFGDPTNGTFRGHSYVAEGYKVVTEEVEENIIYSVVKA